MLFEGVIICYSLCMLLLSNIQICVVFNDTRVSLSQLVLSYLLQLFVFGTWYLWAWKEIVVLVHFSESQWTLKKRKKNWHSPKVLVPHMRSMTLWLYIRLKFENSRYSTYISTSIGWSPLNQLFLSSRGLLKLLK